MKKFFLLLALVLCFSSRGVHAQLSAEAMKVKEPIDRLFKGMQKGDSAMVRSAFTKEVTMASIMRNKNNTPIIIHETSLTEFLVAVGTPHPEVWYEETWNYTVQIDGDFAQAWCDYGFYIGNNFSHCGVDAFQLFNGPNGWKIFHLADTRRKAGCTIPKEISGKH